MNTKITVFYAIRLEHSSRERSYCCDCNCFKNKKRLSILIFRSIGASSLVIVSSNPYLITVLGCVSVWEKTSLMLADDKPNRIHIRYTQRFLSQNPRPITSALSKTVKFLLYNLTFLSNISNKKAIYFHSLFLYELV